MTKDVVTRITIISFIVGLMIAVQYNTVKNPEDARDTRDIWAIRQELSVEKENHSELLTEIATYNEIIEQYEDDDAENQAILLKNTVEDLKQQVGLSSVNGPGLTLNIEPAAELLQFG
ncbi:MAG TPA: hypothetical protein VNQ57_04345, partial [Ureibacillus sp.]|nr:hypothetical protein [Ureibacillus sp.]